MISKNHINLPCTQHTDLKKKKPRWKSLRIYDLWWNFLAYFYNIQKIWKQQSCIINAIMAAFFSVSNLMPVITSFLNNVTVNLWDCYFNWQWYTRWLISFASHTICRGNSTVCHENLLCQTATQSYPKLQYCQWDIEPGLHLAGDCMV